MTELARLRWGIVANAGRLSRAGALPRWAHVVDATGYGSTSARELCVHAGFDPDEIVGEDGIIEADEQLKEPESEP